MATPTRFTSLELITVCVVLIMRTTSRVKLLLPLPVKSCNSDGPVRLTCLLPSQFRSVRGTGVCPSRYWARWKRTDTPPPPPHHMRLHSENQMSFYAVFFFFFKGSLKCMKMCVAVETECSPSPLPADGAPKLPLLLPPLLRSSI